MNNSQKIVAVLGLIAVFSLYYFAPRTSSTNSSPEAATAASASGAISIKTVTADFKRSLSQTDMIQVNNWESEWTSNQHEIALDSLIGFWTRKDSPLVLAQWSEVRANLHQSKEDWLSTADIFYKSVDRHPELQNEIVSLHLIPAFEEMSALEPDNLDTKVALGRLLVDHTESPMAGIAQLMEVIAIDSNHVEANKQLGRFSIISAQYDKAIMRLEKVVSLQPENAEGYFMLAEAYKETGQTLKAVNTLEKCKELVDNEDFRREIDQYINNIISK